MLNYRLLILFTSGVIFFTHSAVANGIKIAFIYPEKGPLSSAMCISEAVIKEHATAFPITLFKVDNKNSVLGTIDAAKLVIDGQVDIVIGTRLSQESLAVAEQFERARTPFIVPLSSHPDITRGKSYVLRLVPNSNWYSAHLARYLIQQEQPKKIFIVTNLSLPYSQDHRERMIKNLMSFQPTLDIVQFEIIDGYADFGNLAKRIMQSRADILYLPFYAVQSLNLIAELGKMNAKIKIFMHGGGPILSGDNTELPYLSEISRRAPNMNISLHTIWTGKARGPLKGDYIRLMRKFCSPFKNELGSAAAYDTVMFVLQVLKENPTLRGKQLIAKAKKTPFNGTVAKVVFDMQGEPMSALTLFTIKNGKITIRKLHQYE